MANVYARETALKNVVGRSDYISNPKRQEYIVLHIKNMEYTWKDYAEFEENNQKTYTKNIQARETVVALPNELADNKDRLKAFCDDLAKSMYGNNRDYEYAVHWNKTRTNLHVHFIYSEREKIKDRKPKIYKRNMYVDKITGKTTKKNNPNAILRTKKGDIQKDKDGNIKYNTDPFSIKDKKFNNKNWLEERNLIIQKVFEKHKFRINVFKKNSLYVPQKKLYKGAKKDYLDYAENWNRVARNINSEINETLKPMYDNYNKLKPMVDKQLKFKTNYDQAINRYNKYYEYSSSNISKLFYSLFYKKRDKELIDLYENYDLRISNQRLGRRDLYYYSSNKNYLAKLRKEIHKEKKLIQARKSEYKSIFGTIERYENFKAKQKEYTRPVKPRFTLDIENYQSKQLKEKTKTKSKKRNKQPKKKRISRDEF